MKLCYVDFIACKGTNKFPYGSKKTFTIFLRIRSAVLWRAFLWKIQAEFEACVSLDLICRIVS